MMKENIKKQQDWNVLHDETVRTIVKSREWLESMRHSPKHPILQNYTERIPYEHDITDPKVLEIRKIADRIRGNVENINSGGCVDGLLSFFKILSEVIFIITICWCGYAE